MCSHCLPCHGAVVQHGEGCGDTTGPALMLLLQTGGFINCSVPQFPSLQNLDSSGTYITGLLSPGSWVHAHSISPKLPRSSGLHLQKKAYTFPFLSICLTLPTPRHLYRAAPATALTVKWLRWSKWAQWLVHGTGASEPLPAGGDPSLSGPSRSRTIRGPLDET